MTPSQITLEQLRILQSSLELMQASLMQMENLIKSPESKIIKTQMQNDILELKKLLKPGNSLVIEIITD